MCGSHYWEQAEEQVQRLGILIVLSALVLGLACNTGADDSGLSQSEVNHALELFDLSRVELLVLDFVGRDESKASIAFNTELVTESVVASGSVSVPTDLATMGIIREHPLFDRIAVKGGWDVGAIRSVRVQRWEMDPQYWHVFVYGTREAKLCYDAQLPDGGVETQCGPANRR